MKRILRASTALAGAAAPAVLAMPGAAGAATAPSWKLSGTVIFHAYYVDQDFKAFDTSGGFMTQAYLTPGAGDFTQDRGWYFGVDEAEIVLNVLGAADNGLTYGFKIELNANTSDRLAADEARLELSGGWGTVHLGDEDGVEDVMNYGGENLLGAAGGFDASREEINDVLIRQFGTPVALAPAFAEIAGDTSDATKATYYSPRYAGFQVGGSYTPTPNNGDEFKVDGAWKDNIAVAANYDNAFGAFRVRASAVYVTAKDDTGLFEDTSAWSVGGILGWRSFHVAAGYADNGDSGEILGSGDETSYWNAALAWEGGPVWLSTGYFEGTKTFGAGGPDSTFKTVSVTADYTIAPGLGVYGELDLTKDDLRGAALGAGFDNDATIFIAGMQVSF